MRGGGKGREENDEEIYSGVSEVSLWGYIVLKAGTSPLFCKFMF